MLILRIICGILLSFTIPGTAGSRENEDIWVERGQNALLKCPIKTENCGELHAVTWFKNEERLGMVLLPNGRKKVGYTEAFINKTIIDYTPKDPFSYLTINTTQIQDEDVYRCDRTYVAPSEKCEIAPYSFKLNVYVKPRATLVTDKNGKKVANNTRLGPFREGDTWNGICEVHETRPLPTVNWYKNNQLVQTRITPAENNSLFNVKSEYPLLMARDTLVSSTECRINLPGIDTPIVYQVKFDVQVRPTKIVLRAETKHKHFVEGDKVTLKCEVTGARPQANITWYNETTPLNPDGNHRTKITTEVTETPNGTFTTLSILTFNATMYESGKLITCAADNIVMRAKAEKSIHDRYDVEVLYPPVINSTPNEYILVNETNQIFLGCSYVSNPASLIAVRWFKNGQSLNLNHSRYKGGNSENPSLEINHSKRGDSGSYVCELTNAIGTTKAKYAIQVDVQYAPVVYLGMEPESPLIETAEANVTLNCSVLTGNPPILTKVRWFLEGALLKELPECNVNQTDDNEDLCNIDPSKLLLQNVGRDFLGNYSCEGYNDVAWGPRSDELPLVVYYAPGNATLTHVPDIPKKNEIVTFKCIVKARGLPVEHKYRFLRDGKVLMDNSTSSEFTVKADIYNRANFSCLAYNEGGEGYQGYDDLDIHVQPTFIDRLAPYTGIHYRSDNATLSCPVQCYPKCDVLWFKDNYGIEEKSPLYTITEEYLPPNYGTGDFETVVSKLAFNISAWPGGVLDIHKDNANYSCASTNNTAGNGVRASTYVAIEYPPVNISVSEPEIQVVEGQLAEGVMCKAKAKPEPSFQWLFNDEIIVHGESLLLNNKTTKALGGNYYCRAYNKHGSERIATKINVLYKPSCMITRTLIEEEDTLICTGEGNPPEISYAWSMKTENETSEIVTAKQVEQVSHLVLGDDFSSTREYFCFPNNSIGHGPFCKIEVLEKLPWYKKWNSQTMLIVVGSVLGVLLAAIIICIIICCVCRRRRRQNKLHGKSSALGDPLTEPGEYENLPFHGLQTAPNKPLSPADLADDMIYADVDSTLYGPINYKAASIYAIVKKKRNNNTGPLLEYQN